MQNPLIRPARGVGEALALPLADTEAQPLERQDVQLPAFIVSQCRTMILPGA